MWWQYVIVAILLVIAGVYITKQITTIVYTIKLKGQNLLPKKDEEEVVINEEEVEK